MKTITVFLSLLICTASLFSQTITRKYDVLIRKADSLYQVKDFKKSAFTFSDAFKASDSKITMNHRYNAACSWALANYADSAFFYGFKVEMVTYGMENNQKGKTVIVFENGRGTDFEYWLPIIKEVSKGNVAFAYNRPRIGSSEDDNQLPTIDHITEILRQSLLAKGLYPPYILVGHSWGAACISNRNPIPDVPVHFIMAGG